MSESKSSSRSLLVIFLTVVLDLVGFGIVIPLLSFYAEDYGATPLQVTLLMASYSATQFLFAPLWGGLSDRIGRRPVLLISIAMTALMLAGFAWANSLLLLFVFRSLHGAFAANISTAQAYVADVTTPENRAKGMGLIGAGFGLGFTIGPFIGGAFAEGDLSRPIWIAAGLSALNLVLAALILKEPERTSQSGERRARSLNPLDFFKVMRHPKVGAFITLTFLLTWAFSMMESTFALFEEHENGLGPRQVGYVLGLIGVVGIIVQGGLIGRLAKRFGEGPLLKIGIPGLVISLIGLAFADPWLPLLGVAFFLALSYALIQPSLYALISKQVGEDEQGFVLGTNQSLSALARAFAPAMGGLLFDHVAIRGAFFGSAAIMLLGWGLAMWKAPNKPVAAAPPGE